MSLPPVIHVVIDDNGIHGPFPHTDERATPYVPAAALEAAQAALNDILASLPVAEVSRASASHEALVEAVRNVIRERHAAQARIAALEAENATMTDAYAATYRALYGLPDDVFTPEMFGAVGDGPPPVTVVEQQAQRIAALEADLARERERVAALEDAIARVLSPAPGVRSLEPWAVGILRAAIKA